MRTLAISFLPTGVEPVKVISRTIGLDVISPDAAGAGARHDVEHAGRHRRSRAELAMANAE